MSTQYDVDELLKASTTNPDFIIDGVHFGRGDGYSDQKHTTLDVKCWRIVDEDLEPLEKSQKNQFYSGNTYIVLWTSKTEEVLKTQENQVYFYWKGEDAPKGISPLPKSIDVNHPVERIVQWAEPPAFLQLFSGTFLVHQDASSQTPHLYLLRGELEKEIHFYEVKRQKQSLRSRTSFILHFPGEKKSVVWHGNKSSQHSRNSAKKSAANIFGPDVTELEEGDESKEFLDALEGNADDYFRHPESKVVDHTPRLFYFNKITGEFSVNEIEGSHSSELVTPFPVLQSHLYTADQPAIFLLDDNDEIWIWYGWNCEDDPDLKTESFVVAINYAKCKSKIIQKLVKVHKVIAGFEPCNFTNLFPVWKKREDVADLQEKNGVLPNIHPLIEMISHDKES